MKELNYPSDLQRCNGDRCEKAEDCERFYAYNEAADKGLTFGSYVDSRYCLDAEYTLFKKVKGE